MSLWTITILNSVDIELITFGNRFLNTLADLKVTVSLASKRNFSICFIKLNVRDFFSVALYHYY